VWRANNGSPVLASLDQPYERYLQQTAQYDLLEQVDEIRLFKVIERGLNAYRKEGATPENEQLLVDLVSARQLVYLSNLRLVVEHAKKYAAVIGYRMPLRDLTQEGNIGLAEAVDRFDYTRGWRFSTYATWWIRQGVTRAIGDKSRIIRFPIHVHERIIKLAQATSKLSNKLNRDPNPFELAEELEMTVSEVTKLQSLNQLDPSSLNQQAAEDSETEVGDLVEDPRNEIEERSQEREKKEYITKIFSMGTLSVKEKYVLSARMGVEVDLLKGTSIELPDGRVLSYEEMLGSILGSDYMTLEDISLYFGVTRERIRQVERDGLKKIREAYHRK